MSEALKAVKDYFLDEVGVNRLESRHAFGNPHSGIAYEKGRGKARVKSRRRESWK